MRLPLPPSAGFGENPFVNLGESVNRGIEYAVRANLVNRDNLQWDMRVAGSTLHNELISLGEIDGTPIQPFGTLNRFTPGRQLGAFFTRKIQSVDVAAGRAIVSDTLEYAGNILPTFEGNVGTTLTLFRNLQLNGQLDWKGGFSIYNLTEFYRDRVFGNSEYANVAGSLTPEQRIRRFGDANRRFYTADGDVVSANSVDDVYIEKGDFVRLREIAATFTLPDRIARGFRAEGASITLGGQNLKLWTDYSGPDPEVLSAVVSTTTGSGGTAQFQRSDFLTIPSPRRFVAKVNLQF